MLLLCSLSFAAPDVPPPFRLSTWERELHGEEPGTRVGMIVQIDGPQPVRIEVWNGKGWVEARQTFRVENSAVMVADLGRQVESVQFRSPDRRRIRAVDWDLLVPVREARGLPPPTPGVLPSELANIGVTSRASWGARSTTCTSTEDDWYRMAVHHTAGGQTYGGTVKGAVQALQAYAMDSGEYCDIPYQFLVGYDGSLWEGRPYDYYSGATGGGNNDGNIAVCFLGCYHPTDCSTSHAVTQEMMDGGQLLVQTLVGMHGIPSTSDSIRGHRDWPGNSTACPGQWLYDRLGELREPLGPRYGAEWVSSSFPDPISLEEGSTLSGTITLKNIGSEAWTPGATFLGTTPRDAASPIAGADWISPTRAATVAQTTEPGATGSFSFTIAPTQVGPFDQGFGMLQEWVAWFADDGGPADGAIRLRGELLALPEESEPLEESQGGEEEDEETGALSWNATRLDEVGGCGCNSGAVGAGGLPLLLLGLLRRRRAAQA